MISRTTSTLRHLTVRRQSVLSSSAFTVTVIAVAWLAACRGDESPRTFKKPEDAVEALSTVLKANDPAELERLFGPGSLELIQSGDEVADQNDAQRVVELIGEGVTLTDLDGKDKVLEIGADPWTFPFPLVTDGKRWRFDLETGADELHNRRIGRNEISTIATLHAYVDAQREYWRLQPMGEPPRFARFFGSAEGTRNGLYWPTAEGEGSSPLGELVALAAAEGYPAPADGDRATGGGGEDEERDAYHGYHFKILAGQGEHASGGARSYLDDKGEMRTGFAAVAWPASYENSGIMTFMVNQFGIVFQKDLGPETAALVMAMTSYDPDETWAPTGD
jgi:hypothetical protein